MLTQSLSLARLCGWSLAFPINRDSDTQGLNDYSKLASKTSSTTLVSWSLLFPFHQVVLNLGMGSLQSKTVWLKRNVPGPLKGVFWRAYLFLPEKRNRKPEGLGQMGGGEGGVQSLNGSGKPLIKYPPLCYLHVFLQNINCRLSHTFLNDTDQS